jgi:hypothetical protein
MLLAAHRSLSGDLNCICSLWFIYSVKNLLEKAWEHNVEIYQIFVDFQKAHDSIRRHKHYAIMTHFGIPDKLIRLTKVTMENSTYHVKIGTMMTDGFKVGTGLKQGDGLTPNLFNHFQSNFSANRILPSSYLFWAVKRLVDYL